jgi:hypothetical protein
LDLAIEALQASRGAILLWEAERGRLHRITSRPVEGFHDLVNWAIPDVCEPVILSGRGRLAQSGTPERTVQLAHGESRLSPAATAGVRPERVSALCVPLTARIEPMGVLYLDAPLDRRRFDSGDLNFLTLFGWIAASCLESTNVYSEVARYNREIEERVRGHSAEIKRLRARFASGGGPVPGFERTVEETISSLEELAQALRLDVESLGRITSEPGTLTPLVKKAETLKKRITALGILNRPTQAEDGPGAFLLMKLVEDVVTTLDPSVAPRIRWLSSSPEFRILASSASAVRWVMARLLETAAEATPPPGTVMARLGLSRRGGPVYLELSFPPAQLSWENWDLTLTALIVREILNGNLKYVEKGHEGVFRLELPPVLASETDR